MASGFSGRMAGISSTSLSSLSCFWASSLMNSVPSLSHIPSGCFVWCICAWRWSRWPRSSVSSCSRCLTWPISWSSSSSSCWCSPCLGSLSLVLSCLCISRTCRLPCTLSSSASPKMAGWTSTVTSNEETEAQRAREVTGPLPAISRMERREYVMEIGGAIYFAIFITIGAFIGINLLVVVVTTNLEQMMKSGEQTQLHQITFSETGDYEEEELGSNQLPLVHCEVAHQETSGLPEKPLVWGPPSNLSEKTCDNFCLVLEAIQENLMQYKEIRDELNMIVKEVRSIRFNQEQKEELMHSHLPPSLSVASGPSVDIRVT